MYCGANQSIKLKLAGAVATAQPPWAAMAIDTNSAVTATNGVTNSTTDVTVVAATKGVMKWFWLRNADTASITLTMIYDDNSTQREVLKVTLLVGDNLEINSQGGWRVTSSAGVQKTGGGVGGTIGTTDNAVLRADGTGGSTAQGSAVTIDDNGTLTVPAGQAIYVGTQVMTPTANLNATTGTAAYIPMLTTGTSAMLQPASSVQIDGSGRVYLGTVGTTADRALQLGADKAARGAIKTLSDGASITPDMATGNFFSVTLGGNRTLENPTNLQPGQSGCIWITQDGGGSRTLAYGSYWDFAGGTAPTLTTTGGAVDVLVYAVESTTHITAQLIANRG